MPAVLPEPHEARQLVRLRALRVQRAQAACTEAQRGVEAALAKIREQERVIERLRAQTETLVHAIVGSFAPHLPRWGGMAVAQRDKLADLLERAEYALIDDEHALEAAREKLSEARTALTRAQASEDAVRGLAKEATQLRAAAREQRAETELEDLGARRAT